MVLVQKGPFFRRFFLGDIGQENVFYDILEKKMPFQAIKTISSKSRKIDIFPKGLTHVIGPKTAVFPTFLLMEYRPGKQLLRYSRTKICLSRLKKTRSSKSRKIDIFVKWLNPGFCAKMAIFPTFIFWQYRPGRYLLRYSRMKKCLLRL